MLLEDNIANIKDNQNNIKNITGQSFNINNMTGQSFNKSNKKVGLLQQFAVEFDQLQAKFKKF